MIRSLISVDAVGSNLEQHRPVLPEGRATSGAGTPLLSHSDVAAFRGS
jgi:hypothetical protein